MGKDDKKYMKRCLELSRIAKSAGSYPVGSVMVRNDEIIAEGFEGENTVPAPVAHAEIVAVLKAIDKLGTRKLNDCILYTTKEPCFMCSYLIRQSDIKGVVFASPAGDIGGATSSYPILTSGSIKNWPEPPFIKSGVMQEEYEAFLKEG